MDNVEKIPEPTSADEYMRRAKANQRFEGHGLETKVVTYCPFCAAPDFLEYLALDVYAALVKETTCAHCGRSAKALVTKDRFGGVTCEIVQTAGPDIPKWLYPAIRRINTGPLTPRDVAKVCYAANKALNDIRGESTLSIEDSLDSTESGVNFYLGNPEATPEDSHENWLRDKAADGWVYGEVKDPVAKTHPCIRPYHELAEGQRVKDHLFVGIVRALRGEVAE